MAPKGKTKLELTAFVWNELRGKPRHRSQSSQEEVSTSVEFPLQRSESLPFVTQNELNKDSRPTSVGM